jgi:hypothetical protein
MDSIFQDFKKAYGEGHGYDLSMTLSPIPPASDPNRLSDFFRSTTHASVRTDFKYQILYDASMQLKLPVDEGNGWIEVYSAYWKAVGEILNAETASRSGAKVRRKSLILRTLQYIMIFKSRFCIWLVPPIFLSDQSRIACT